MKKVLLAILIGFGSLSLTTGFLYWLTTLPASFHPWVELITVGGAFTSIFVYCFLSREEKVYICYDIGDDIHNPNDVKIRAICTSGFRRDMFLKELDCYREVTLNEEIPEATWEDLYYKTHDGYVTIE